MVGQPLQDQREGSVGRHDVGDTKVSEADGEAQPLHDAGEPPGGPPGVRHTATEEEPGPDDWVQTTATSIQLRPAPVAPLGSSADDRPVQVEQRCGPRLPDPHDEPCEGLGHPGGPDFTVWLTLFKLFSGFPQQQKDISECRRGRRTFGLYSTFLA